MPDSPQHSSVLDIAAEQLGKPYARAMLDAAAGEGVAELVLEQLSSIVDDGLGQESSLAAALSSPRVSHDEKSRVIDRLFAPQVHSVLLRTMKVMNAHGRLGFLSAVRDAAASLLDEQSGRLLAEVRTAVPLADELRSEVQQRLSSTLGKQVRLVESIDENLIGGMVIRVGDTVFDNSVAGRLTKVGKSVKVGFAQKLLEQAVDFVADDTIAAGDPTGEE